MPELSEDLPNGFRSSYTNCGEVRLHFVHNARAELPDGQLDDPRTPILFLHGFPEYWAAWTPVLERLSEEFLLIAPDQRGYNLSDAPARVSDYSAKKLVSDMLALSSNLLGNRKLFLAGHDWGASVAYAAAINVPERIRGLIIVNGVHPAPFQRAIIEDPEQQKASQYFHFLRNENSAERMSEDDFRRTFGMLEKFSDTAWLSDHDRAGYRKAWSRPGRLNAMLNWYRASPIIVPAPGEPVPAAPLMDASPDRLTVRAPHLLIWGARDTALRASSRQGLSRFAPDLTVVEIEDGDHWVIHTHGQRVADEIARFVRTVEAGARGPRTR